MARFSAPTTILFDLPAVKAISQIASDHQWERAALVVDSAVAGYAPVAEITDALNEKLQTKVYNYNNGEPTVGLTDSVANYLRSFEPQVIVAIGGGSSLDLAKAVAVMLANPGSAADYQGIALFNTPGPPVICVPTTAGTGAEISWAAVITDETAGKKQAVAGPLVCPAYAVLDPRLTATMPLTLTLSTGIDAIAHAIESYCANDSSFISRMHSASALGLLRSGLRRALVDGNDLSGRRDAQLGATLAGVACSNAGVGLSHALAYPIGVDFRVPHGDAVAMVLASCLRVMEAHSQSVFAELNSLLAGDQTLIASVDELVAKAGYQRKLRDFGVRRQDLWTLAEKACMIPAFRNQRADLLVDDCQAILADVF